MDSGNPINHPRAITVGAVISCARSLLGTRYQHQGRTQYGVDCIGFIILVMQRLDLLPTEFESRNYGRLPRAELIDKAAQYCTRVERAEAGCLILIRWPGELFPGHAALFTGVNLLHAYQQAGHVVEHGFRGHWLKRSHSFWRLPGVSA